MKYFSVSVDSNYVAPLPLEWWGLIDKKTLQRKKRFQIPEHLLFQVKSHMQMVFTDIIEIPCFMVSELVMEVIKKYDPFISFERIVFYDKDRKKSMIYYLPLLNRIELTEGSTFSTERISVINGEELGEHVIVEIVNDGKTYIIMRMDLIESILRRGAIGIGLKEIKVN